MYILYMAKSIWTPDHHIHIYFSNGQFENHAVFSGCLEFVHSSLSYRCSVGLRPGLYYAVIQLVIFQTTCQCRLWGSWSLSQLRATIHTHIHTYKQLKVASRPNPHISGLWKESGVPRRKPHGHRKSMKTATKNPFFDPAFEL